MKNKPVLLVLAAGLGSRFGGLKQLEPLTAEGEFLLDFSAYDARRAGFEKIIFIIREEHQTLFAEGLGNRIARHMEVGYAYQALTDLPAEFSVPEGRTKPWGTAHAVRAARHMLDGPAAVINADDYYGPTGFAMLYQALSGPDTASVCVGYALKNTLTEHGTVSRGVCETESGLLTGVTERTRLRPAPGGAEYTEDNGTTWTALPGSTVVSLNLFGLRESYFATLEAQFTDFLRDMESPLTQEFYLPQTVDRYIHQHGGQVQVLASPDKWYGMTYPQDKESVKTALTAMRNAGAYPAVL